MYYGINIYSIIIVTVTTIFWQHPENEACKNFQKYACNNYYDGNYINKSYSEITEKLNYDFNMKFLQTLMNMTQFTEYMLEQNANYRNKFFIYWESCKRESQRNVTKYFEQIQPSEELLNWPLLLPDPDEWLSNNETFDFWPLLGEMQSHGLNNAIVQPYIIRNENNTLTLLIEPAFVPAEGSFPENNALQVLLKALQVQQNVPKIVLELHNMEQKLQEFLKENDSAENHNQELNLKELAAMYPKLNLTQYLEKILGPHEMANISQILIKNPEYFLALNNKNWSNEELQQLTNYLMLKFLYYLAMDSSEKFAPYECLKDLRKKFDLAVNAYYYFSLFADDKETTKTEIFNMISNIKSTMVNYISENHLELSAEQIEFLKKKLQNIKINIGNLPANLDYDVINNYYGDLNDLAIENYYKNHMLLLKHRFKNSLLYNQNQTYFVVTNNDNGGTSTPFYIPQQNMIVIPFATLQEPVYSSQQTPLEKLSLFGFILAHELTHAWDTTGLQYDEQGLLLNHSPGIVEHQNFINALECMQQQMSTEDIDERIADLFAVRVVYDIYRDLINTSHGCTKGEHQAELMRQFFINLSQFFCGKDDLNYIDHDTDEERLQQIIINMPEFDQVFQCSEGSVSCAEKVCRLY